MNGVTGRMGYHQHLLRSVLANNADGGVPLSDGRQWEMFVRHVLEDAPFPHDLHAGARAVRVAELGVRSSAEGRRVEVPEAGVPGAEVPA